MKHYILLLLLYIGITQGSAQNIAQNVIPTVEVIGEGSVEVTPTLVNISVSIIGEGKDVKLLRQENAEKIAKVIQVLNKEEIPMKNFQTNYISLYKNYDFNTKTHKYLVSQTIKIKLEDLTKYETIMDALFEVGVNQINSVTFDIDDNVRAKLLQDVRIAATDDARKKALLYATSLDQNIGKALAIKETNLRDITPVLKIRGNTSSDPTLALGSIFIDSQITVTFELTK
nr:SIMPL domain-containing protein [uncultured Capnocytophaga sp.]